MLRRIQSYLWPRKTLKDCESGAVSIEFAFTIPILMAIFFAVAEISYFNMNTRRAQQSVDFAAEYLSRDDDNFLTHNERYLAEDIWQIVNATSFINTGGHAYANSRGNYSRSFSSIEFVRTPTGCTPEDPKCTLEPKMDWSFLATQGIGSPVRRSCDQEVVSNQKTLDKDTLPEGVLGRGSIVVADFTYKYKPFFEAGPLPESENHIYSIRATRGGATLDHVPMSTSHMVWCS
ncbi:MAG: TadE/TadG family type IV pilus assembly protein [Pseudomonadota bacterium]